jgi:hypothetical protein
LSSKQYFLGTVVRLQGGKGTQQGAVVGGGGAVVAETGQGQVNGVPIHIHLIKIFVFSLHLAYPQCAQAQVSYCPGTQHGHTHPADAQTFGVETGQVTQCRLSVHPTAAQPAENKKEENFFRVKSNLVSHRRQKRRWKIRFYNWQGRSTVCHRK